MTQSKLVRIKSFLKRLAIASSLIAVGLISIIYGSSFVRGDSITELKNAVPNPENNNQLVYAQGEVKGSALKDELFNITIEGLALHRNVETLNSETKEWEKSGEENTLIKNESWTSENVSLGGFKASSLLTEQLTAKTLTITEEMWKQLSPLTQNTFTLKDNYIYLAWDDSWNAQRAPETNFRIYYTAIENTPATVLARQQGQALTAYQGKDGSIAYLSAGTIPLASASTRANVASDKFNIWFLWGGSALIMLVGVALLFSKSKETHTEEDDDASMEDTTSEEVFTEATDTSLEEDTTEQDIPAPPPTEQELPAEISATSTTETTAAAESVETSEEIDIDDFVEPTPTPQINTNEHLTPERNIEAPAAPNIEISSTFDPNIQDIDLSESIEVIEPGSLETSQENTTANDQTSEAESYQQKPIEAPSTSLYEESTSLEPQAPATEQPTAPTMEEAPTPTMDADLNLEPQTPAIEEPVMPMMEEAPIPNIDTDLNLEPQAPTMEEAPVPTVEEPATSTMEEAPIPNMDMDLNLEPQAPIMEEPPVPNLDTDLNLEPQAPTMEEPATPTMEEAPVPNMDMDLNLEPQAPIMEEPPVPNLDTDLNLEPQAPIMEEAPIPTMEQPATPATEETPTTETKLEIETTPTVDLDSNVDFIGEAPAPSIEFPEISEDEPPQPTEVSSQEQPTNVVNIEEKIIEPTSNNDIELIPIEDVVTSDNQEANDNAPQEDSSGSSEPYPWEKEELKIPEVKEF